jgi:hypothetical protein
LIDPVMGAVASKVAEEAGKRAVEKGIEKITAKVQKIEDRVSESFVVLGREIRIDCPSFQQNYSLSLTPKGSSLLHRKVRIELGKVKRATIRSIVGLQVIDAVNILEQGFEIDLSKLVKGEVHILDVEYAVEDPGFIDSLVSREVPNETPHEDLTEYWLVAQLKHPEALRSKYGRIDLRDLDFIVNVDVHKEVHTKIPKPFRDQLESIVRLTGPLGRDEKFREWQRIRAMRFGRYGKSDLEILDGIVRLFSPSAFRKFVDVTGAFTYYDMQRGANVLDFPFPLWPKFMMVISRTDLGLEKPVAEGSLVFKRQDMLTELENLFG